MTSRHLDLLAAGRRYSDFFAPTRRRRSNPDPTPAVTVPAPGAPSGRGGTVAGAVGRLVLCRRCRRRIRRRRLLRTWHLCVPPMPEGRR